MQDDKGPARAVLGAVAVIGAAALVLAPVGWIRWRKAVRAENEQHASAMLKVLASANADFRGNDRDNNGIQDYWTADVAGFHDLVPAGGTSPLELIEAALAAADPTRPGARPWRGYWYRAIPLDELGTPYADPALRGRNYSKFGFCAYPADYGRGGVHTFMINEGNTIYRKDLGGAAATRWPSDEQLGANVYSRGD